MAKTTENYKFKFSFVMPIYNVEEYLAETVESILAQTMDFESNCQIVFVNDGSPDNSEEVCLRYQQQFPKNIKYIKQANQGVSAARNRGIREAEGKYISFLDSDDKLSPDTLSEVYDFFEKHQEKIDVISIKLITFDAYESQHPLNFKYEVSRVVDINQEPDHVQLSGGSAFVKTAALKGRAFDTKLVVTEDAKLLTEIILERQAYGVLSEPVYWYRKRQEANSAISSSQKNKKWYLDSPEYAYQAMMDYSQDKLGFVHRYVQNLVMYDLQWRFRQVHQNTLSAQELEQYKQKLYDLLKLIDDDIILNQRNLTSEYKLFILGKKHGVSVIDQAERRDQAYYFGDQKLYDFEKNKPILTVEFFEPKGTQVTIEGYLNGFMFRGVELFFTVAGKKYKPEAVVQPKKQKKFLGELIYDHNCFTVDVPLQARSHIRAHLRVGDKELELPIRVKRFSGFSWGVKLSYRIIGRLIVTKAAKSFKVEPYSRAAHIKREIKVARNLIKKKQVGSVALRCSYYLIKPFIKKRLWIISDRMTTANDNGLAFFRYAVRQTHPMIKPIFTIARSSEDYQKIQQYGPIINRKSLRYKLLFFFADKVISSEAVDYVVNPYGKKLRFLNDLLNFDFVFLQHGITKDDMSDWLNKYNKNIKLFVTATNKEYNSILRYPYGYGRENVCLTGFPRYDLLESKPQNKVIIAPTWRGNLVGPLNPDTHKREYSKTFIKSGYYKFFQSLINDKKLNNFLEKHNIVGEFYLHPSLFLQFKDFKSSARIKVVAPPYDYKKIFEEGVLLVTDFSSVAFDFAYLNKPVVYAQFDKDTFYESHTMKKGYFSYEEDGLGPITPDLETTRKEIMTLLKIGKFSATYQKRKDSFFKYQDTHNSKRVYQAILALDQKQKGTDHIVAIGCGTGRSGTVSLSLLLGGCRGFLCTHERLRHLPWEFNEEVYNIRLKEFRAEDGINTGDVHSVYLPYLERFIADIPNVKIVCSERDPEGVATSFEKKVGPTTNHWFNHKETDGWKYSYWDQFFPKYDVKDRHQAIVKYAQDYAKEIRRLQKLYPSNILIVDITDLSTHHGQKKIFDFVGVEEKDRRYIEANQSIHNLS